MFVADNWWDELSYYGDVRIKKLCRVDLTDVVERLSACDHQLDVICSESDWERRSQGRWSDHPAWCGLIIDVCQHSNWIAISS